MKATGIWTQVILSSVVLGAGILILGSKTGHAEHLTRTRRQPPPPDTTTTTTSTTTTTTTTPSPLNCGCTSTFLGQSQRPFCTSQPNSVAQSCGQGICNVVGTIGFGTEVRVQLTQYNCGTLGSTCAVGLRSCSFNVTIGILPSVNIPGTCQSLQNDQRVCGCAVQQSDIGILGLFTNIQPFFQTPCARV